MTASYLPELVSVCVLRIRLRGVSAAIAGMAAVGQPAFAQSTGEPWRIVQLAQSSLVFARDGTIVGEIGREMRTSVALSSLPTYVPQAFIAVEDQRFYQHDGVDVIGVLGAIKGRVLGSTSRGGASTITQQLVGYMHPDEIDRREVSGVSGIERKLREQAAAREMEKHYTKEQILEAYLNQINLGHGWYGVEAAARHYFGKPAARITLAEAATLAALPRSQPVYDPIRFPARAKQRRDLILSLMADQGYVTHDLADRTKEEPVVTAPNAGMSVPASYFVDAVRQQAERVGIPVLNGGFRIYTTLEPALQRQAVDALVEGITRVESQPGYRHVTQANAGRGESDYLQGMLVALDPASGDVRALVGGRNYALSPFDRATAATRQPGSSIKPLVFARAIEDSVPGNAIVPDTALSIVLPSGEIYEPQDVDGKFLGPMTVREGLVRSRNAIAIQLGLIAGMDSVAALSQQLGITPPMLPVPASAIGASVVHPIDLVAAYTAFVNSGAVVEPRFITRIDDLSGHAVLARPPSTPRPVIDPRAAFIVRNMMVDVVDRGSGTAARKLVPAGVPMAGKTGTTNDNTDVWFIGMTPDLVAGVWLGFDKPSSITPGAVGGSLAAPIWGQMVGRYYASIPTAGWAPPPEGLSYVQLDRDSGQVVTPATPEDQRYFEFFIPGTEPGLFKGNPWSIPQWGPFILTAKPASTDSTTVRP